MKFYTTLQNVVSGGTTTICRPREILHLITSTNIDLMDLWIYRSYGMYHS